MALESVDYSEEKALKILEIVLQEDKDTKKKSEEKKEKKRSDGVDRNVSFKEPRLVRFVSFIKERMLYALLIQKELMHAHISYTLSNRIIQSFTKKTPQNNCKKSL